jgi:hypothetical protein
MNKVVKTFLNGFGKWHALILSTRQTSDCSNIDPSDPDPLFRVCGAGLTFIPKRSGQNRAKKGRHLKI